MNNRQGEVKSSDSGWQLRVRWWGGHTVRESTERRVAEVLVAVWRLAEELVQENGIWLWSESKICGVGMKLKAVTWPYLFHLFFHFFLSPFFLTLSTFLSLSTAGEMNQNSLKMFYLSTWASTSGARSAAGRVIHTHTRTLWTHPRTAGPHCTHTHTHTHTHYCWVGLMSVRPLKVHHSEAHARTQTLTHTHTHRVYTIGNWLCTLFISTMAFQCVILSSLPTTT